MRNKLRFLLTLLVLFVIGLIAFTGTTEAKTYDEQAKVKETVDYTYNGVKRTIITLDTEDVDTYLKIGDSDPIFLDYGVLSIGFDENATIWYIPSYTHVAYINTDLYGVDPINLFLLVKYIEETESSLICHYVEDAVSLVFDEQNFVIGYKTLSGETYPIPSLDEILADHPSDVEKPTSTPGPGPVYQTPEPSPSYQTPMPSSPTTVPTSKPAITPSTTPVDTTNTPSVTASPKTNKISIIKKGSYTYIYKGKQVVSKFGIKSGKLKWTITTKKGELKKGTLKKAKFVGLIKKSQNILCMTKDKKVYIISSKTGKKKLFAKNTKKVIKKGKYVTKIMKTNGKYISVTNK